MALKQKDGDGSAEPKKRRRVGFASIGNVFDAGVEANECIKVFLVKCQDEVGSTKSCCIDPIDLNHFFGDDGKIYGYKGLQINIWISLISFHAYAEITFESTSDGGKGITDLKPAIQSIFGETLIDKQEFLQTFSKERHCIQSIVSNGAVICCDYSRKGNHASDGHPDDGISTVEVIRMELQNLPVGLLYSRLVPLVLLLVEGSRPVDVTDPRWEIIFVVKKMQESSGDCITELLGFATVYHFYHYPDGTRFRISQLVPLVGKWDQQAKSVVPPCALATFILVLPPYQGQGHGCRLLDSIYSLAVSENIYDVTVEEPSDYFSYLRTCVDTLRLLAFEPIKPAVDSVVSYLKDGNLSKRVSKVRSDPPASLMEAARQKLKINKKQFLKCWNVLIYLNLDSGNSRCMDNFRACISDHVKGDIVDKDAGTNGRHLIEVPNDYDHDMTFVMFQSAARVDHDDGMDGKLEGDVATQEEQLNQLVDSRMEEIAEVAQKVSLLHKSKTEE